MTNPMDNKLFLRVLMFVTVVSTPIGHASALSIVACTTIQTLLEVTGIGLCLAVVTLIVFRADTYAIFA